MPIALREIHRIVRARGRLAVVYNRRVLENSVQAGVEAIIRPLRQDRPEHRGGRWRTAFDRTGQWVPVDQFELAHVQFLDREGVVRRVSSVSYVADLPGERRAAVLGQVWGFVRRLSEPIELPYRCELFAWERIP